MTTKEVLKELLRQTGFYRKKILFFGMLGIAVLTVYFIWQNFGRTSAAVQPENIANFLGPLSNSMDIIVEKNGKVIVDGKEQNRSLKFYQEYDELRILIFDSPGQYISNFRAMVHLPEQSREGEIRQIIYAVHGVGTYQAYASDSQTLIYEVNDISPSATLTIVADFPKGMIQPNFWQRIEINLASLSVSVWLVIAIVLPAITLILMLFMILRRRTAQILPVRGLLGGPPENVSPAIPGVLIDGVCGAREIAATLIDLARRGYIFIIHKGNGQFSFGIRRSGNLEEMSGLSPFEKELLAKIFLPQSFKSSVSDVEMRIGRHIFSRKIARFYLEIYNAATGAGYFVKNPAKVHLIWKYTGIVLFFLSFAGFMFGALTGADPKFGLIFWVGGLAAAAVIIRLSPFMPARTRKGNEELREWLEFREFLIDRRPATGVDAQQGKFEQFLAYAIVLGAEVDWAKRFSREPFAKPDWYETPEQVVTLESFAGQLFPLIGYVADNLARSHEPTVE